MKFSVNGLLGCIAGIGLSAALPFAAPANAGPMPVLSPEVTASVSLMNTVAFRANHRAAAPRAGRVVRNTRIVRGRPGRIVRRGNDRAAAVAIGAAAIATAAIAANRRHRVYHAYPDYNYRVESYPVYGQGFDYPVESYAYSYGAPAYDYGYAYGYPATGVAYYGRPVVRQAVRPVWRGPRYVAPRYAGPHYVTRRPAAVRYAAPRFAAPRRVYARPVAVQRGHFNRGQGAQRGFR